MPRQPFIRPALRTKPPAAKLRVARGAEGDEESMKESQGAATPGETAPGITWGHQGQTFGGESGGWMRDRRPRGRKKSSASLVEGRRSGLGKTSLRHGGEVEAVSAGLGESEQRAPR